MNLSQYSDEELLEEVKHRGFKIELPAGKIRLELGTALIAKELKEINIGGVVFELTQ